ncbi:MAG TPA: ABC transporter permease [Myxococcales bacterium]|nr:ABC transporter permease [Myxococcales bacterium]
MWSSFYAIFRKELVHMSRDRGTLRIALMIPVMQLLLFGFIDETVHNVPTVVADQDRTSDSRLFIEQMRASKTFEVVTLTTSPEEARAEIRDGKARVGVVIPPKYHDRMLRKEPAQVLVLIDGSDSTVSSQALASINGIVSQNQLSGVQAVASSVAAQPVILFNPENRTANYIIPGLIAILLLMAGVLLASGSIVREKEQGTFEQLLVTPIHPIGLILGKLAPFLAFGLVETTIVLSLMRWAFGVPIHGSLLFLYGMAILYLLALLPIGILISTKAKTQMGAQQLSQSLFLPAMLLSGYIFPFEGLPFFLKAVGDIFPTTHMIRIMRAIVLRNASPLDVWPEIAILAGTCVFTVFLASRSIHKVTT